MRIYAYRNDETNEAEFAENFSFSKRHDFFVDADFCGIALKIKLRNCNFLNDRGVRRNIGISLVDLSLRCEIAVVQKKIYISKDNLDEDIFVDFPLDTFPIKPGHNYRVVVTDLNLSLQLSESVFHLYDIDLLGDPAGWYEVRYGGLHPAWTDDLYKSLHVAPGSIYYVKFGLAQRFGDNLPMILPEVELRLHYADDRPNDVKFDIPLCLDSIDFHNNNYCVEFLLSSPSDSFHLSYAELLCMGKPIAGFVFDTAREDTYGMWEGESLRPLENLSTNAYSARLEEMLRETEEASSLSDENFDALLDKFIERAEAESCDTLSEEDREEGNKSLLSSLDHLTGLKAVKEKLTVYERVVRFNKLRADNGLPTSDAPLHAMFLGSPGTGKTTVAKLMGCMLHRAGMLSKGHVVVRERATLLGQNYNSEAEKTLAAIEEAQGGILLIDEAYQLYQPSDARDPGKFVIETLMTALADDSKRDWMLVLAGYPDEIRHMTEMNPGFKSRIPDSNVYIFDDFSEDELMEIAEKYLARKQYSLSPEARDLLARRLAADYSRKSKSFGNARHVLNMLQTEILPAMAVRVTESDCLNCNSLTEIQAADIPKPIELPPLVSRYRPIGFTA